MTTPHKGDRIRVTFEAEYNCPAVSSNGRATVFLLDGVDDPYRYCAMIPNDAIIEVLAPVLKVGDIVETQAQLDALPDYSVVRCNARTGLVAQKNCGKWYVASMYATSNGTCNPLTCSDRPVVLHVGETAE